MAKKNINNRVIVAGYYLLSTPVEAILSAAMEQGSSVTGASLVTFKPGALDEGLAYLNATNMRVMDARDFEGQKVILEAVGDADAIVLPEIGVAIVSGASAQEQILERGNAFDANSPIESIDPEPLVFAQDVIHNSYPHDYAQVPRGNTDAYLRGFLSAAEAIAKDLKGRDQSFEPEESVLVAGVTWGLTACKVPSSPRSGSGIKVAVLDTGMDLGHPDFSGREFTTETFVGQPVQDLHSHGTHCTGTACGSRMPAGNIPRYGVAHQSSICIGKVLTNSGGSIGRSTLLGMNWAIAQGCEVISMSLGGQSAPVAAYTAAGRSALNRGLLIIAAAGNQSSNTGAPANSPTIMSVASLDRNLAPSSFSNFGKIDIAGPGNEVYSSIPRPRLHGYKNGTSMATPHVAGCAALWASTSPNLRGMALWQQLVSTAKRLPFPASRVGAGLVQAPQS